MEQRKLVKHGGSTLMTSLPIHWLKDRGLEKGDSVFIEEEGNKLIINTEQPLKIEKVSVDITRLDRTSILLCIQSLYRFGYNEIEFKFKEINTTHHRKAKKVNIPSVIHYVVGRCIGIEVVEESSNRMLIKYITKETREDFKTILKRIFLLLKETADCLLEGIKTNDLSLISTIEKKHDNISRFVSYSLRLLNKFGYPDVKKTCLYYHVIASIDKIVDVLKYNARDLLIYKKKLHPETIDLWNQINKSIEGYYELFYKFSLEKANELGENRDHVKNLLNKKEESIPKKEIILLTKMIQILEIILDLTEFRMGLEY
ncbi:hypothetical protein JXB41_01060 [Candidatus Woesearchaeota archaeon]|nr:hypothetical protein [Candidatus Woesearchaeota archaeon]